MNTRADSVGRPVYMIAAASPLLLIWAGWIGLVAAGRWDGRAAEVGFDVALGVAAAVIGYMLATTPPIA